MSSYSSSIPPRTTQKRLTLRDLRKMRTEGQRIAMLTAYDVVTAALVDRAGVDMILVGDSLGNVVLGHATTLPVTLDNMIHHTAAVVRGSERALVVCDLPFGTTTDPETALRASVRVLQETGCQAVKIEGGLPAVATVRRLVDQGIPVVGHIGLTPQSIHQLGGYYRHGKTDASAAALIEAARALEEAGAFALVLECVVESVADQVTRALTIPTIGIGSGTVCSGEVLVINDVIGLSLSPPPSFATQRAQVGTLIWEAAKEYVADVKQQATSQQSAQSTEAAKT